MLKAVRYWFIVRLNHYTRRILTDSLYDELQNRFPALRTMWPEKMDGGFYTWKEIREIHRRIQNSKR